MRAWVFLWLLPLCVGCMPKLAKMAKEEAHLAFPCPTEDLKVAVQLSKPPYTVYTVKGCGQYVRYRGTCESMRSGCDAANRHPECNGTCRLIDREDRGTLDEEGS